MENDFLHDYFGLDGKIALITGSSRGLGLAFADGLARAGATVILNGRNSDTVDEAVDGLNTKGLTAHGRCFDVTESQQVKSSIDEMESKIGPISILVNNAGIQRRRTLEEFTDEDWHDVIDTNLTAAFRVGRDVAGYMIKRKQGKIINTLSMQSEVSRNTIAPYAASKGGLKMLTKGMATDWGKYNIQVNGVGPGYFTTVMNQPLIDNPEFDGWLKKRTPMARWGDPDELIGTVVFLASKASDFITGQAIYVDGGILATI